MPDTRTVEHDGCCGVYRWGGAFQEPVPPCENCPRFPKTSSATETSKMPDSNPTNMEVKQAVVLRVTKLGLNVRIYSGSELFAAVAPNGSNVELAYKVTDCFNNYPSLLAENGRLKEALEGIAREQSAETATIAADRFQNIARDALGWKHSGGVK